MITGFNTDIEHDGVIYHVQTEDKGVETPLILSLVYNRGTILASKRTPYEDLIQSGLDEKVLAERLQKQHKLLCAAVRAGRIEELIKMTARDAAAKRDAKQKTNGHVPPVPVRSGEIRAEVRNVQPPPVPVNHPEPVPASVQELKKTIQAVSMEDDFGPAIPQPKETFIPAIPQPKEELIWDLPLEIIDEDLIVDDSQIIEAETILSADAVEIISDLGNSLKPRQAHLEIRFLNETAFRAGERKTLNILVYRGAETHFVGDAQVMVKVLGSSFRPLIFHARTNERGVAVVHLQLPQFRSGRGAILVRAIHAGEEAELRQIVRQN